MTCELDKKYIYIYKGDDTNWNNEQFLTVNVTSEAVDLSTMTAKFILGSYTKTFPLTTGSFQIDLAHAVTGAYACGPINGVIQILDAQGRIKTASNTIPFYVTNKVIASQDMTYNVPVPEGSQIDIDVNIGFGDVAWGVITGNLNDQLDLKAALYSKVSKVGDTMTGDLVMDNAAVDFGDFKVSTDDGLAKIEGTQYGLRVDTTSGLGAALLTTRGLGEVLTTLDVKDTYSGNSSDPISGKGVAQAISTKQDTLTAAQLTAVNSGIDSTKVAQIATNTQAISNEVLARQGADNNLQTQIDALSAASDVKDIVGTYAELQAYDTSHLGNNDIIKVLTDETHDGAPSYYRWNKQTETFTYIGSESASYTKGEADAKFETITGAAATYATKSELTTGLATKASSADGTTIVDNGTNISTVAVKEQNNALAIKEWVGTKAQYDAIVTKDANTLYTVTDDPDTQAIIVDSALSSTSTNPVQNKVINTALATKQDALPSGTTGNYLQKTASGVQWAAVDALPSQTGQSGKYLTTDGTTASWGTVASGGLQNTATGSNSLTILGNTGPYNAVSSINIGKDSSAPINNYATLLGNNTKADGYGGVAIGQYARAGGHGAIAIGHGAYVNGNTSQSYNSIAIGGNSGNQSSPSSDIAKVDRVPNAIQLGIGTNSTEGTFQVWDYPLLNKSTGKIYSDRLPSGGGVPTITWYTGQTGDTITIPDTTGASLVKVYKNGKLLRQGVATTNYNFTGGSNNNEWITLSNIYQTSSANSWYYEARFGLPANRSDMGAEGAFFGFSTADCGGPALTYYNSSNNLRFLISSNGTSWDGGIQQVSYALTAFGQDVDLRFGFELYPDGVYYFAIKMPYEKEYTTKYTWAKTTKAFVAQPMQLLNVCDGAFNVNWNKSKLYMKTLKVVADNDIEFDGRNAVLGTDYTNHNCTAETVSTCTNDYCVSGTTLTLAEDVFPTDKIAVEIY